MSGESSEKNEKPTAKRLREAREKGQVIKSVEITSGGQLVVLVAYFFLVGNSIIDQIGALIRSTINQLQQPFIRTGAYWLRNARRCSSILWESWRSADFDDNSCRNCAGRAAILQLKL